MEFPCGLYRSGRVTRFLSQTIANGGEGGHFLRGDRGREPFVNRFKRQRAVLASETGEPLNFVDFADLRGDLQGSDQQFGIDRRAMLSTYQKQPRSQEDRGQRDEPGQRQ